jgi:hypothetical protein
VTRETVERGRMGESMGTKVTARASWGLCSIVFHDTLPARQAASGDRVMMMINSKLIPDLLGTLVLPAAGVCRVP